MGQRFVPSGGSTSVPVDASLRRFPSPFALDPPAGAEGWAELYPYALPFSDDRRPYEESVFWFRDTIHWPRVLTPFEATFLQYAFTALGQFNHRHYLVPGAKGVDVRLLHGYCYLSPGSIDDPLVVAERRTAFAERAGHYYEHWESLEAGWMVKVRGVLDRLEALRFPRLPDAVPLDEVTSGRGLGRPYDLTRSFHALLDLGHELWQYHFEMLNLGYAAYLDYFHLCRSLFPDVSDLEVARTVAGIDVDLFRPDQELRRLAKEAVTWGLADALCAGTVADLAARLHGLPDGGRWLDDFEGVQHPWFNYSTGSGFYADDVVWADRLDVPFGFLCNYIRQVQAGHDVDPRTQEQLAERDRIVEARRAALTGDVLVDFDARLHLARTVFHFVENHNFYVEHWGMSVLWRKTRELSGLFVKDGFWNGIDDIFLLRPDEIDAALWDMVGSWANGTPARGPARWPDEVVRRRAVLTACEAWAAPRALGVPPLSVTEPFTVMLWGVTSEAVATWLGQATPESLVGFAASPGVVEGRARVVLSPDALDEVEDGEILVTELTNPSWTPVFGRIAGTVTEVGGMMSHVAIVCREYGLPAVTGVAGATTAIRTGQRLRVDGDTGRVVVLDEVE
jgi:pyruvate, water dikinase